MLRLDGCTPLCHDTLTQHARCCTVVSKACSRLFRGLISTGRPPAEQITSEDTMSRPSGKSPLGTTDPVTENSKGCSRLCRQFTFTSRLQARLLPLCDCDLPFKHDVPSSTTALQDCLRDQSSATSPLRDLLILDTRPPGPPENIAVETQGIRRRLRLCRPERYLTIL